MTVEVYQYDKKHAKRLAFTLMDQSDHVRLYLVRKAEVGHPVSKRAQHRRSGRSHEVLTCVWVPDQGRRLVGTRRIFFIVLRNSAGSYLSTVFSLHYMTPDTSSCRLIHFVLSVLHELELHRGRSSGAEFKA